MKKLEKKHPLAIRWFHWINFPLLALMIWSGTLIYWAYPRYANLPQTWWRAMKINNRLAEGMALHFFFMWLFMINGVLYVAYTIFSGEWRDLVPNRNSFREAWHVLLHDLHLRKEAPPPRKFNGAQQISYTGVILMGLGSLVSGLAIYKPVQFGWLTKLFFGYQGARFVHFALTVGYVMFFVIHVAQVIRAGWNNFRAMVIGYELVMVPDLPVPAPEPAPASAPGVGAKERSETSSPTPGAEAGTGSGDEVNDEQ
ncbi:MAG: thiosulfate reductase [Acidobacteria bacterium]|nr:MAG: thiosulfate reductase [Acidobacteriota bacterium]